jgi:hypothetical protein
MSEVEAWKEATVAWSVCASLHREYCQGKDPFYKTRQADFVRHENKARERLRAAMVKTINYAREVLGDKRHPTK